MQLQSFNLYDIIVDLIPGILFLFFIGILLFPINPSQVGASSASLSGPAIAVLVVVMGYIVGRLVHLVSRTLRTPAGIVLFGVDILVNLIWIIIGRALVFGLNESSSENKSVESSLTWILDKIPNRGLTEKRWSRLSLSFEERFFDEYGHYRSGHSDFSRYLVDEIIDKSIFGTQTVKKSERAAPFVEKLGQATLYQKESLYSKYEILTTFYRNLTFIFLTASSTCFVLPSLLHNKIVINYDTLGYKIYQGNPEFVTIVGWASLLLAVISLLGYSKFESRKEQAFLVDWLSEIKTVDSTN